MPRLDNGDSIMSIPIDKLVKISRNEVELRKEN